MNADPTFMRNPRKILLATDLSCRCDRALGRAALLSKRWHAGLMAMHVLEPTADSRDAPCTGELPSWRRAPGRAHMAEKREFVRARDVDLVVSGTHGRAAIMEVLIGSDAKRLLDLVPCDMMTVRQRPAA